MKKIAQVKLKIRSFDYECNLNCGQYAYNGQIALTVSCVETGEPLADITKCLVGEIIEDGYVAIKNHGDTKDIMKQLVDQKIIEKSIRIAVSGFDQFPICKLLIPIFEVLADPKKYQVS